MAVLGVGVHSSSVAGVFAASGSRPRCRKHWCSLMPVPYHRPVRISVSKVAAVCGYNQYATVDNVTELFLQCVYQDEDVLDADSSALHMQGLADAVASLLCSDSEAQRLLAASLTSVLAERRDTNVEAVQEARQRLTRLTQAAVNCGTIGSQQARQLEQALSSSINTEHGTRTEDAALVMYERKTGRAVRSSNEHLLIWLWPRAQRDGLVTPLPLRRLPMRSRRRSREGASGRAAGACAGLLCGCHRFAAIDRSRAALAIDRHELCWWFRKLRGVDSGAEESSYCVNGKWDALGLMRDLRIARGRALLAQLRECVRQRQRLARAMAEGQPAVALPPAPLQPALAAYTSDGSDCWLHGSPVRRSDYHHGGSLWDLDGLRADLRIEEQRLATLHAHVRALAAFAEALQAGAEESSAFAAEAAAAGTAASSESALAAVAAAEAAESLAAAAAAAAEVAATAAARASAEAAEEEQSSFYLAGAVDGMTDEEVPMPTGTISSASPPSLAVGKPRSPASSPAGSDAWSLQEIVVEVKNRVAAISDPPPFYDQLQLVTYCLMLGCAAGDLVQCLRARSGSRIHITRVGLHDAPMRHGEAWHAHVLPKLFAFANAVHAWRRTPSLRYAYLLASDPGAKRAKIVQALAHLP